MIKLSPIIVIDQDGKNMGAMPLQNAKGLAMDAGLDLVEIAPNSRPPVCKIMDFGKFKFNQAMKEKKQRKKHQKSMQTKEVRLSPSIQEHDVETKLKSVIKFLSSGHKVNIKLEFKRRELAHQNLGFDLINSFLDKLKDSGNASKPKMEGRNIFCVIEPKEGGESEG